MLSNGVIIWVCRLLCLIPQLVLVPYLIRTIGNEGYSIYVLMWSLIMSIELLGNSLQEGIVKYSASLIAQSRIDQVSKLISTSFVCAIVLAFLVSTCLIGLSLLYNNSMGKTGLAIIIVSIIIYFLMPIIPYVAIIESVKKPYITVVAETIFRFASLVLVIISFALFKPSVYALITIMSVTFLITRMVQIPIAYRMVGGLRNRPTLFRWASLRLISKFSLGMFLVSLFLVMNVTGLRWLMSIFVSTNFVGHLAIMVMPAQLLKQMIGAITITVMPSISACQAAHNNESIEELVVRGTRYVTILVLVGGLVGIIMMKDIISVWVGREYSFLADYALMVFIGMAFLQCTDVLHHTLKGLGEIRAVVMIYMFGLVIVPLGIILVMVDLSDDPYLAVSLGLLVGYLVCGVLNILIFIKVFYPQPRYVILRSYIKPLLVAVPVYCLALSATYTYGFRISYVHAVIAVIGVILYFLGYYYFITTKKERDEVDQIIFLVRMKVNRGLNKDRV